MGRWNTFVSVFPIKMSLLVDPLEEEPLEEEPLEEEPLEELPKDEPEPDVSVFPLGVVRDAPFVENTTLPSLSVRYCSAPAEVSLPIASDVG